MNRIVLSPAQARKIILHAAGLSKKAPFGKGREAVFRLIDHLGFIQVDTNYVVERAHHHAIVTRVPDYKMEWLDELQADGRIFEFLTYASGYMPMEEFRYAQPVKDRYSQRWADLPPAAVTQMNRVLERISRDGPLMARDFENDRVQASSGWWDWRPSKMALERLHLSGQLVTTRRSDFQKLYDLPMNVIPREIDQTPPSAEDYARQVIRRSLQALGIAYEKDIRYRARFVKNVVKEELKKLVAEGEVCEVEIEGLKTGALYMLSSYRKKKIDLTGEAFILSPFDVMNVLRHRLRDFFGFEYQVECFVPEAKRKYGYFALPILIADSFVARMDAKADRKQRTLVIHNLHFEKLKITKTMLSQLGEAIRAFAKFNQCASIQITKSNDRTALAALRKALS